MLLKCAVLLEIVLCGNEDHPFYSLGVLQTERTLVGLSSLPEIVIIAGELHKGNDRLCHTWFN